jgi:hypothetical protein
VSERDGENVMSGGSDRADTNEDEREGSDEFGDAGAELCHPPIEAKRRVNDNAAVAR